MTPAQLEHLRAIDAHLERLLSIAEKRTPGEWHCVNSPFGGRALQDEQDELFVECSAGNAEAGWRATRAVIKRFHDSAICREWHGYMQTAVEPILAAFPLELIQKP